MSESTERIPDPIAEKLGVAQETVNNTDFKRLDGIAAERRAREWAWQTSEESPSPAYDNQTSFSEADVLISLNGKPLHTVSSFQFEQTYGNTPSITGAMRVCLFTGDNLSWYISQVANLSSTIVLSMVNEYGGQRKQVFRGVRFTKRLGFDDEGFDEVVLSDLFHFTAESLEE